MLGFNILSGAPISGIVVNDTIALTGVQGTSAIGSILATGNPGITGVQAMAGIGSLTVTSGPNFTNIKLTGVGATAGIGSLVGHPQAVLTGVQAAAGIGSLTVITQGNGFFMSNLTCEAIPTPDTDTEMTLRWSDTKGVSWENGLTTSLGLTGQYFLNAKFLRLGMARDRVFEISWACNQQTMLTGVFLRYTVAAT